MIDLSNVTLWSCVWTDNEKLLNRTMAVLCYMQQICKFGEVILFTKTDPACDCPDWKIVKVDNLTGRTWNLFVNTEVPKHVTKDFAMSVHEDGFIIEPDLWTDEFLHYDYIGAPWPDHVVGNGGFNIESRKLLQAKASLPFNSSTNPDPSDAFICRTHRQSLESNGIRFAPEDLAARFSVEQIQNDQPSFGFHGRTAATRKYAKGWRRIREKFNYQVEIVYIYVANHPEYEKYARQFVQTYLANPPGEPHSTTIVCNCGEPGTEMRSLFEQLPNCSFLIHNNAGRDIGGYQAAARRSQSDLIVFFGASSYFRGPKWLTRMVDSFISFNYSLHHLKRQL